MSYLSANNFFKELEISDQEMEQHPIAPACYHYISHIYRQFAEPNLSIAFASLLPCPWLYHDIGKSLNLKPSPNPLYQQWIETYITDELEQQIREEGALVNQLYRESDETDKKKMLEASALVFIWKPSFGKWLTNIRHGRAIYSL